MSKLLVVGECLAKREPGGPFTNRAGRLFRETMTAANVNPERAEYAYPLTLEELMSTDASYIVLSGDKMLKLTHPELRIGECHGRAMLLRANDGPIDSDPGPILFPVFNHEAVARDPKQLQPCVQDELGVLRRIATDREHWTRYTPITCVRCRGELECISPEGVVYCNTHWPPAKAA